MSEDEKARLVSNIGGTMQGVPRAIQLRQLGHLLKADTAYRQRVAEGLGINARK